ncbi:hypothetical protein BC940DRAFT_349675 [Gongronella butleri]|nr:hypothetical protein BC940DRAFT_349675 [Gongronella butleri]
MSSSKEQSTALLLFPAEIVFCILGHLTLADQQQLRFCSRDFCDFFSAFIFRTVCFGKKKQTFAKMGTVEKMWINRKLNLFRSLWVDESQNSGPGRLVWYTPRITTRNRLGPLIRCVDLDNTYATVDDIKSFMRHCPNITELRLGRWWLMINWVLHHKESNKNQITIEPSFFDRRDNLANVPIHDLLAEKLHSIFATSRVQCLTRLESYADLPMSIFCRAILPHLGHLQQLDVAGGPSFPFRATHCLCLHELALIQRHCPFLKTLTFTFQRARDNGLNSLAPEFMDAQHQPGQHPNCDACMNPWFSLHELTIHGMYNISAYDVPGCVAFICLKFPSLQRLALKSRSGPIIKEETSNAPELWHGLLKSPFAYLPCLSSIELEHCLPVTLDAFHYFFSLSPSPRPQHAMTSLKIYGYSSRSAIDLLQILAAFPHLQDLLIGDGGLDMATASMTTASTWAALLYDTSSHPLRQLSIECPVDPAVLVHISAMCPDLTFLSLRPEFSRSIRFENVYRTNTRMIFAGRRHERNHIRRYENDPTCPCEQSLDMAPETLQDSASYPQESIPPDATRLDAVQMLLAYDRQSKHCFDRTNWIAMPFSTRLKTVELHLNRSRVQFFIQTPNFSARTRSHQVNFDSQKFQRLSWMSWFTPFPFKTSWDDFNHRISIESTPRPLARDKAALVLDRLTTEFPEKENSTLHYAKKATVYDGVVAVMAPSRPRIVINGLEAKFE